MASPDFSPEALFDLAGIAWSDLFEGAANAWEALGRRLKDYLADHPLVERSGRVMEGAVVTGDVAIGAGTVIEPGAWVQGPCLLGRDVQVRHGAYVRGHVIAGDGAVIGHATEVKGAVFLPGAKAGHFAYVGDSILGREVNLGAGTKLANLRLDGREVAVRAGGERFGTGLRKLGALLGDGVQTGCNSVTNPGAVLGRGARLLPCSVASGHHEAGTVVGANGGTSP